MRALLDKATPGPWRYVPKDGRSNQQIIAFEEIVPEYSPTQKLATIIITAWKPDKSSAVPNATVIVEAHNALPALLAIAEAAQDLHDEGTMIFGSEIARKLFVRLGEALKGLK